VAGGQPSKSVQKLQTTLHAKAKAEAGYRFDALYDKISREDILPHAYAQCRSNKGAPGWTARTSRTSKSMGCSDGLANWRLGSGRRLTDRTLSEDCTYRRPMSSTPVLRAHLGGCLISADRTFIRGPLESVCPMGTDRNAYLFCIASLYTLGDCHAGRNLSPAIGEHAASLGRRRSGKELSVRPAFRQCLPDPWRKAGQGWQPDG
jgi:hypothetical protein